MVRSATTISASRETRSSVLVGLFAETPSDVDLLEGVESGEDAGAGDASEDIRAGALHHRHEAFVLEDLDGAVDGSLVLDGRAGGHHHATTNGVDGVGHQAGSDGHAVAQAEGEEQPGVGPEQDGLERIVETEVHAAIHENTHAGNHESSVQTLNTVGFERLLVDVDEAVVLAFAAFALGVVGQTGSGVVERVHEQEGQRTGATAGQNVGGELLAVGGVFRNVESRLDFILEGEVERLRREVTQAVGQISSPQRVDALALDRADGAVDDALVRLVETALTDHLVLVLDEQLDALDGGGGRLRHDGGHARQSEILRESQFVAHIFNFLRASLKKNYFFSRNLTRNRGRCPFAF